MADSINSSELVSQTSQESADELLHDGVVFINDLNNFSPASVDILADLDYNSVNDSSELESIRTRILTEAKPLDFVQELENLKLQQNVSIDTKSFVDSVIREVTEKSSEEGQGDISTQSNIEHSCEATRRLSDLDLDDSCSFYSLSEPDLTFYDANQDFTDSVDVDITEKTGAKEDGGEEAPVASGEETPAAGGEKTPAAGGEETPAAGGEQTPASGGEETPVAGGQETHAAGDTFTVNEIHEDSCRNESSDINDSASETGWFEMLPTEIMQYVLSFLSVKDIPMASLVNKFFYSHISDPLLWRKLDFSEPNFPEISLSTIEKLIQGSPLLKDVSFHGMSSLPCSILELLAQKCPLLEQLDLSFIEDLTEAHFTVLASGFKNLQTLNLEGCEAVDDTYIGIMCTGTTWPKLRSLNLSHCDLVMDETISLLTKAFPGLAKLNIDGISWLSDKAIVPVCDHLGSQVTELILDGDKLTDASFEALAKHCTGLRVLSVSFSQTLTDITLNCIQHFKFLKTLVLRKGQQFSSLAIRDLFVTGVLHNLRVLDLSECQNLCDEEIEAMVQCCGASLSTLSLNWCWNISDKGLEKIVGECGMMKTLELQGLKQLQGHCLLQVPVKLPRLVFLNLSRCNSIIDELLFQVVGEKNDLEIIDYYEERIKFDDGKVVVDRW